MKLLHVDDGTQNQENLVRDVKLIDGSHHWFSLKEGVDLKSSVMAMGIGKPPLSSMVLKELVYWRVDAITSAS